MAQWSWHPPEEALVGPGLDPALVNNFFCSQNAQLSTLAPNMAIRVRERAMLKIANSFFIN